MPGRTPNYGIEYPLGGEYIRRDQLESLATDVDTALQQAVTQANQAAAVAAAAALTYTLLSAGS